MKVSPTMDLQRLATLMGSNCHEQDARAMRSLLVIHRCQDTEKLSPESWKELVWYAKNLDLLAADDDGPTKSDLREDVNHG